MWHDHLGNLLGGSLEVLHLLVKLSPPKVVPLIKASSHHIWTCYIFL